MMLRTLTSRLISCWVNNMLDVTIYYKDGSRSMYDHVAQITHISADGVTLDFITDFNDHISKCISADSVSEMRVKVYE